jgi:hypothetical protein
MKNPTTQQKTGMPWKDEKGIEIQFKRITSYEKAAEKTTFKLFKFAEKANQQLTDLKKCFIEECEELVRVFVEEHDVDITKSKGNHTFTNFDQSIRIEVKINKNIAFNDLFITACKEKLSSFLGDSITAEDQLVKTLVMDAFNNTKGRLDPKKVMGLLKYKSKIKDPRYAEAMELLEKSITRPDSKTYFKVSARQDNGEYKCIDLNFSSI